MEWLSRNTKLRNIKFKTMRTVVALGLVFVVMVSDVVVARPEPLPMFLVNRAIKASEFEVKKADQEDVPIIPAAGKGSANTIPILESLNENSKTNNDKILPVGKSNISIVKDRVENVPAAIDLVSNLPLELKFNDTVVSEVSIDQAFEQDNSPTENRASNEEQRSNNEITSTVVGSDSTEENKGQTGETASPAKKLVMKKAPIQEKPLKSRKIYKVASLNRVRLLNSLIDFLLDSLIPTNNDFRRDQRTRAFDEYFDYAFPSSAYGFNYF